MQHYLSAKGWLTEDERRLLYHLSVVSPGDGIILNIGIEYGASLHCFRDGDVGVPIVGIDLIGSDKFIPPDVYAEIIKGDSAKIAKKWDRPISVLFVDGDHTTKGVLADTEFCKWVVPGGYAAFHDCYHSPAAEYVDLAVQRWYSQSPEWEEVANVDSIRLFKRDSEC